MDEQQRARLARLAQGLRDMAANAAWDAVMDIEALLGGEPTLLQLPSAAWIDWAETLLTSRHCATDIPKFGI